MTVCIEIYTLQLYIIDLTQRGCHTLRLSTYKPERIDISPIIPTNEINEAK